MTPSPLRAVVVDDCPDMRDILRLVLTRAGHVIVAEAGDGAAGLAAAVRTAPDVVVLDLDMPVMDGYDALPLMRDAVPGAKVVVFSHDVGWEIAGRLRDLGAHAWLRKGAPLTEVLAVVASAAFTAMPYLRQEEVEQTTVPSGSATTCPSHQADRCPPAFESPRSRPPSRPASSPWTDQVSVPA